MTAGLPDAVVHTWAEDNVTYVCPSCHGHYVLVDNSDGTATCDGCKTVCRLPERAS